MSNRQTLTPDVVSNRVSGYVVDPESGEKYDATFKDLTDDEREELNELEEAADDGDVEAGKELERKVIDEYLLNDGFEADSLGIAWKSSIMVGFLRALGDNEATQEAEEFFDTMEAAQQGNR